MSNPLLMPDRVYQSMVDDLERIGQQSVFGKCWCGQRFETTLKQTVEGSCPSCTGMLRLSYSMIPFADDEAGNYTRVEQEEVST